VAADLGGDAMDWPPALLFMVERCNLKPMLKAPGSRAGDSNTIKYFQVLPSISTCARDLLPYIMVEANLLVTATDVFSFGCSSVTFFVHARRAVGLADVVIQCILNPRFLS